MTQALRQLGERCEHAERRAARKRRGWNAMHMLRRHPLDQLTNTRVGGDVDRPASPDQDFAKGKRREKVPTGAAGDE